MGIDERPRTGPGRPGMAVLWAVRDTYERLGLVVFANTVWLLSALLPSAIWPWLTGVPVWAQLLGIAVCLCVISGPMTLGMYRLSAGIIGGGSDSALVLFSGFSRGFVRAAGTAALNVVVAGLAAVTIAYWLSVPSTALKVVGFVWVWLLLLWGLAQCWVFPILALHEVGIVTAERLALYLVIGRPYAALTLSVYSAALVGLVALPWLLGLSMLMGLSVLLVGLLAFAHLALVHTHMVVSLLESLGAGAEDDGAEPTGVGESER